ncbi:NAD-dependent epimerase/dehydratase family protein [Candidatus Sumerlaeota bacterium]|nr:NAD-dependent epimerase/dehydratase family protein [Candidatus Sumerlaeota bacterium]
MIRVIVIGGTGHIGTYLVPRLVEAGYEVICISRKQRTPYLPHALWKKVRQIPLDRAQSEQSGDFGNEIKALEPDIVIDLICYSPASARSLVSALQGRVRHFLHCGAIWVHGHIVQAPSTESQPRNPFCDYGKNKAAIETYLLGEAHRAGFPATVIHPGHIVGSGWIPLNPAGNFNLEVFEKLARGEELALPNLGLETVHHVHADDVAQAFMRALENPSISIGENFHAVSPAALSLRGFAEEMAAWFGQTANLAFLPWDEWKKTVSENDANQTWDHIAHSPCCSITKAQKLLNYQPRYTSLQAVQESVKWLMDHGKLDISFSG